VLKGLLPIESFALIYLQCSPKKINSLEADRLAIEHRQLVAIFELNELLNFPVILLQTTIPIIEEHQEKDDS
jgi:hypothetical protein